MSQLRGKLGPPLAQKTQPAIAGADSKRRPHTPPAVRREVKMVGCIRAGRRVSRLKLQTPPARQWFPLTTLTM